MPVAVLMVMVARVLMVVMMVVVAGVMSWLGVFRMPFIGCIQRAIVGRSTATADGTH